MKFVDAQQHRDLMHEASLRLLAPIRTLLENPEISEIMINGPKRIFIEKGGRIEASGLCFASDETLHAAVRHLAQFVNRPLSAERPILEARLADGSRVQVVVPPASPDGISVAIRKFSKQSLHLDALVETGSLSAQAAHYLAQAVQQKRNVLIGGGTGSGKTSLLNALSRCIPNEERIVVLEDSRELQLHHPHVLRLEAQPGGISGDGSITLHELFRATLRLRPDRILLGEVRGREALELVQAMISGHGGSLSTLHATHPRDTLHRLETMVLSADRGLPLSAVREQITSAVDVLVQIQRFRCGQRGITTIAELAAEQNQERYQIREVFVRSLYRFEDGLQPGATLHETQKAETAP